MTCLGCGVPLTKRHQRVYCSNRCQRALERAEQTTRWLETGVGTPASHPGHYIRVHILAEQGGLCAICAGEPVWCDRPLVLVLDHVDGDSANNRQENLRLVCPNCDSQLPTYKARNRGRGRAWRRQRYADGKSF